MVKNDSVLGDDENQLLQPLNALKGKEKLQVSDSNLQDAEVDLMKRGILELPALDSDTRNGKLVITELSKRYGDKQVVNNLSLTIY